MSSPSTLRKILFISGSDFKEKSIQVIRKTPEAYNNAGWDVHYVVGRDNSSAGDYFYEKPINPEGLKIYRFNVPLSSLHGIFKNSIWAALWFRIRTVLLISGLVLKGIRVAKKYGPFHIIYGYEVPGVLAARFLRFLGFCNTAKFITRFQGVLHVKEWLRLNQRLRFLTNWEAVAALRTKADLTIMTNDGSQGLDILRKLRAPENRTLFFVNGVDEPDIREDILQDIRQKYYAEKAFYCLSISRLDPHKRIDRGIRIIAAIVKKHNFKDVRYIILGGGMEFNKLQSLIEELNLSEYVTLAGPVKHSEVQYHLHLCDMLISMYTSSNVGNPLLEAIRHNKPVITLNNGDTADWVKHNHNGLIYDVRDERDLSDNDYIEISKELLGLIKDESRMAIIKDNLKNTESEKLWTWQERLDTEIFEVTSLLK